MRVTQGTLALCQDVRGLESPADIPMPIFVRPVRDGYPTQAEIRRILHCRFRRGLVQAETDTGEVDIDDLHRGVRHYLKALNCLARSRYSCSALGKSEESWKADGINNTVAEFDFTHKSC